VVALEFERYVTSLRWHEGMIALNRRKISPKSGRFVAYLVMAWGLGSPPIEEYAL
jgi:hypothetical protein